ncbi:MAG: thymidylate kinase [Proteobacteria bacterium]|nr:thymidylate kinase [Pseudomonadota bacterium]
MNFNHSFYGRGLTGVDPKELKGALIVIEGGDGAGRSTQVGLLRNAIEKMGHPTTEIGLKRSRLVGDELTQAMQKNVLCPRTLGLFYATDLADQLENSVIPALKAGFVVVADRYIYTLIARDIVRGADPAWIKGVYGIALIPNLIFYLKVPPRTLAEHALQKNGVLNYWESGMDIQRSGDMHECFIYYQNRLWQQFNQMKEEYKINIVNGNRDEKTIHKAIFSEVKAHLESLITQKIAA